MRVFLAAVVFSLLFAFNASAMVNSVEPDITDLRYDAIGAFATPARLGIGPHPESDNDWWCAATLVSPSAVVLARHCVEMAYGYNAQYAIRFRRALDGSLGSIEQGPSSFFHVYVSGFYVPTTGDVLLAYLVTPVTHITPIQMSLGQNLPGSTPITIGGWGREGPNLGEGVKERLRLCNTAINSGAIEYPWMYFRSAWDPLGPGCGPNNNDSGGPLLHFAKGTMHVVGVTTDFFRGYWLGAFAGDPGFTDLMFSPRQAVRR